MASLARFHFGPVTLRQEGLSTTGSFDAGIGGDRDLERRHYPSVCFVPRCYLAARIANFGKGTSDARSFQPVNTFLETFLDQLTESIGIVLNTIEATMRTEGLPSLVAHARATMSGSIGASAPASAYQCEKIERGSLTCR